MDAVTYPQKQVIEFVNQNLVPLRVQFDAQPLATDFNVKWTPTLVTLDSDGGEHHRSVGFLSPDEFISSMKLGVGKVHFDQVAYDLAISELEKLLTDHPKSDSAPEALYLLGVSKYKHTNEPRFLKEAYEQLYSGYPSSEWTKRAYPYRLL
jgi:hypothetical protein